MIIKNIITPTTTIIRMPKGARHLAIKVQNGKVCLWSDANLETELTDYYIEMIPTGGYPPRGFTYIDTVLVDVFVFHLYVKEGIC